MPPHDDNERSTSRAGSMARSTPGSIARSTAGSVAPPESTNIDGLFEAVIRAVAKSKHPERFKTLRREVQRVQAAENELKTASVANKRRVVISSKLQSYRVTESSGEVQVKNARSDMGHYIFDEENGEMPLTVLDLPSPGPADYTPNYTKLSRIRKMPEYSAGPLTNPGRPGHGIPGPKYQTAKGMVLKQLRQVTLKGRNHPVLAKAGMAGPGPAGYLVPNTVGSQPHHVKTTIKQRVKYAAGPRLLLELPSDSHGFVNAEELFALDKTSKSSKFDDGPKFTLSGPHRDVTESAGPGPGEYPAPSDSYRRPEPGASITGRRKFNLASEDDDVPGPATYLPLLTDKHSAPQAIVIPKRDISADTDAPAPNEYSLPGKYDRSKRMYDWRGPNITFRDHNTNETDDLPGPSDYRPTEDHKVQGGKFGTGERRAQTHLGDLPQNLKYFQSMPGAAAYNPHNYCIGKNSGPKFSFGASRKNGGPRDAAGPGDYNIRGLTVKGHSTAPQFSLFGLESQRKDSKRHKIPAPGAYDTAPVDRGKSFTMAGRNIRSGIIKRVKSIAKDSESQYDLRGLTRKGPHFLEGRGVSLKSRGSPHVYTGINRDTKLKSPACTTRRWSDNIHLG